MSETIKPTPEAYGVKKLKKGTVIKIEGIPFFVEEEVRVRSHANNFALIEEDVFVEDGEQAA